MGRQTTRRNGVSISLASGLSNGYYPLSLTWVRGNDESCLKTPMLLPSSVDTLHLSWPKWHESYAK